MSRWVFRVGEGVGGMMVKDIFIRVTMFRYLFKEKVFFGGFEGGE